MSEPAQTQRKTDIAAFATAGVVILVSLFANLGAVGLLGPDEPRYAWIARAMAETGDWVTPRLWGAPWFEKPVLYYWAAAIGFRMHLPPEWAARLPSAIAALVAAKAIAWFARRHYAAAEDSIASPTLLAPVIFATSVAAIAFARAATPDMLFSAAITLAMVFAANVLRQSGALRIPDQPRTEIHNSNLPMLLLWGASLGLGVLAKGPAAVILAGGAVGIWAIATSNWRAAIRLAHPVAIAAFSVVALPWYALCARRNPDFLHIFIFQHNFERYLTPLFQHQQPFWFFGPITILALLPWSALLIAAVHRSPPPLARKILEEFSRLLRRLLGRLPHRVLQLLAIEAAQLHSPGRSRARVSHRNQCRPRIPKKPRQRDYPERRRRARVDCPGRNLPARNP